MVTHVGLSSLRDCMGGYRCCGTFEAKAKTPSKVWHGFKKVETKLGCRKRCCCTFWATVRILYCFDMLSPHLKGIFGKVTYKCFLVWNRLLQRSSRAGLWLANLSRKFCWTWYKKEEHLSASLIRHLIYICLPMYRISNLFVDCFIRFCLRPKLNFDLKFLDPRIAENPSELEALCSLEFTEEKESVVTWLNSRDYQEHQLSLAWHGEH